MYGHNFALVYDRYFGDFALDVAARVLSLYERDTGGARNKTLLDVGCGTGHATAFFANRGYKVLALDNSEHMLTLAEKKLERFIASGLVKLVLSDALDFRAQSQFGLAVCINAVLNHLDNVGDVEKCLGNAYDSLAPGGVCFFDLLTRRQLRELQNVVVQESDDRLFVNRGIPDEDGTAATVRITGFVKNQDEWQRFEHNAQLRAFDLSDVVKRLSAGPWTNVIIGTPTQLELAPQSPESELRVTFLCRK